MPTLVVSGTAESVRLNLSNMLDLTRFRKNNGWEPYQHDESHDYETERDHRVCPLCKKFQDDGPFVGDEVRPTFPSVIYIGDFISRPQVHIDHPEFEGVCRCNMFLVEPAETLVNRLDREYREIMT